LKNQNKEERFNQIALQHIDAAFNLAKWLTGNHQDAEDLTQESFMKAFRYFDGFQGLEAKPWLLAIVRNTCYSWLKTKNSHYEELSDDISEFQFEQSFLGSQQENNPEQHTADKQLAELLNNTIQGLPVEYREVIVLREQEGFSYHEIAAIAGIPLGTVMSRLARARTLLRKQLASYLIEE
jgi:RNA polymerase sigma factor (sigma-70 family)